MEEYKFLFGLILVISLIVLFNRFVPWWVKIMIVTYYISISYIFVSKKMEIDQKYENILPVPEAYWDSNSGWVDTMFGYFFWPLGFILLFLYYKWFRKVSSKVAKGLIVASLFPVSMMFIFVMFLFGFGYGYRP